MPNTPGYKDSLSFGPFRLNIPQRTLLEGDQPVSIGSRALDILIALLEHPGELVSKRELLKKVWPDTVVVEKNLTVHISALRNALGDGQEGVRYIVNIPGRGYCFVAPVVANGERAAEPPRPDAGPAAHNLPVRPTQLVGRRDVVSNLVQRLAAQRLITIVGPGGIGKTSVALEVAREQLNRFSDGVWLIDLAPVSDPSLVPTALAAVLGLDIHSDKPLPAILSALQGKHILMVLDNCEHVIEGVAALAAAFLRGSNSVHLLATSREPLRIDGEQVQQMAPLESPLPSDELTAADALKYPAIRLLVERVAANLNDYELSDAEAKSAAEICRMLDGIPLAIELAAARVATFGMKALASNLDDRLRLLTGGHRESRPRHRTMVAALDWSHRLLSESEQTVLRRLAIFTGGFTLEAARAVVSDPSLPEGDVMEDLLELVAKSMIATDLFSTGPRLRLLETTHAYARAKLEDDQERQALSRRHAQYYRDLLEAAESNQNDTGRWASDFRVEIDNIRSALNWAFSPAGDPQIGVQLAAASAPVWLVMSLRAECHTWMERAVAHLEPANQGTRQELIVRAALAVSLLFTKGMTDDEYAHWIEIIDLAKRLGDTEQLLNGYIIIWAHQVRHPNMQEALDIAGQCAALAGQIGDPALMAMADWMIGHSKHHLGRQADAQRYLQHALQTDTLKSRRAFYSRYGFPRSIDAHGVLSNSLWLQGFPDQALRMSAANVNDARTMNDALALCVALIWNSLNIYLTGIDPASVARQAAELAELGRKHSAEGMEGFGHAMQGLHGIQYGNDIEAGICLLTSGIDQMQKSGYGIFRWMFIVEPAKATAACGRIDQGLGMIEELERLAPAPEHWFAPELLRVRGELLAAQSESQSARAEKLFMDSIQLARRQGALSWELRAATSLVRLQHDEGRQKQAAKLLAPLYGRLAAGGDTRDLRLAKQLLDELLR
jgi:predicted ATPase/DNA-binding winged helix-turn-helix (wHTH) protein